MDMVMPCWWKERDSLLLQNETKGGNWIQVEIKGTDGINAMGIGSRVTIYDARRAGNPKSLLSMKETASGFGYASGQEAVVHFGLGEKETCDVQITLPHGKGTITRANLSANQRMVISTNEELRDENLSNRPWPPELPGVKEHYASVQTDKFLEIPTEVRKAMSEEGYLKWQRLLRALRSPFTTGSGLSRQKGACGHLGGTYALQGMAPFTARSGIMEMTQVETAVALFTAGIQ